MLIAPTSRSTRSASRDISGTGGRLGSTESDCRPSTTAPPSSPGPWSTRRRCTACSTSCATSAFRSSRSPSCYPTHPHQPSRHPRPEPRKETDMTTNHAKVRMDPMRKTALVAGVFYLITFVSIPTLKLYHGVLTNHQYITHAGSDGGVLWGALLEVIVALAGIGTAVTLFPVVKRENEAAALGFVTTRVIEGAMILVGVLSVLSIVTLRHDLAG